MADLISTPWEYEQIDPVLRQWLSANTDNAPSVNSSYDCMTWSSGRVLNDTHPIQLRLVMLHNTEKYRGIGL